MKSFRYLPIYLILFNSAASTVLRLSLSFHLRARAVTEGKQGQRGWAKKREEKAMSSWQAELDLLVSPGGKGTGEEGGGEEEEEDKPTRFSCQPGTKTALFLL